MRVRLAGPDAKRLADALAAEGVEIDSGSGAVVYVLLHSPELDAVEDSLTAWVDEARRAAHADADVVTVIADELLDGGDVAGCAVGHGLLAASRAYAMERARAGGLGNVVACDPERLDAAASAVAWLVRDRITSGELLRAGASAHGRQRP